MNKNLTALFSLIIILAFIVYIILDSTSNPKQKVEEESYQDNVYEDNWSVFGTYKVAEGVLTSVTVTPEGLIYIGGDSFVRSLFPDLSQKWNLPTEAKITSLAVSGDTVYASTTETILLISAQGQLLAEWGPYEDNSIITSLSANDRLVAFADAGNKRVFMFNKNGELYSSIGQSDYQFVIPSPYFDVALGDGQIFIANTGQRRIETWTTDARKLTEFGEPGTAPGAFCGCCNPAHFTVIPQGFITAEKGINRISMLGPEGKFIEFVTSSNNFVPSVPLDIISLDGATLYAANSADSVLYIYKRK